VKVWVLQGSAVGGGTEAADATPRAESVAAADPDPDPLPLATLEGPSRAACPPPT